MSRSRPVSASPLDAHLGFWLRYVSNHVSGRFQTLLEAEGVTVSEWVALRTLLEQPRTHGELIQALGMTKGATSKVLTRLEDKGLASRELAEGRAREQVLSLTALGLRLVPRLAKLADDNEARFFGHLDPAQRDALKTLLRDLVQHHQLHELPVS